MKLTRLKFRNGWSIDIHEVKQGQQYYQRWAPGVESQPWLYNLKRGNEERFWEEVLDERLSENIMAGNRSWPIGWIAARLREARNGLLDGAG